MTRLARAFVATAPPADVLDALQQHVRPVAVTEPQLRWLPRSQWHVTLQFLGAVADAETLAPAIETAAATIEPFGVRLTGGGAFPAPRRASVVWIGVEPNDPLRALADAVMNATSDLGYRAEARPYHPHLTLARATKPRSVTRLVDTLGRGPIGPSWTVTDVRLVESDTRPSGALHTTWAHFPLAPEGA